MLGMKLDDLENHLSQALQTRLHRERTKLAQHSQSLAEHHPRIKISLAHQALKNLQQRFNRATQVDTQKKREHLLHLQQRFNRATQVDTHTKREHLLHLQKRLNNSSLNATMRRGFAVLKSTDGAIISSAQIGQNQDKLTAQLNDGEIVLKVLKPA
jgi:exodeoxyribonuclease VII large subunit